MKLEFSSEILDGIRDVFENAYPLWNIYDEEVDQLLPGAKIVSQSVVNEGGAGGAYFIGKIEVPRIIAIFEFEGVDDEEPCETCGWSPEEGTLWITEVGNVLATRYGCYGGVLYSSIRQPGAKTEQQIQDELDYIQGFMKGPFDKAWEALNVVR